METEEKKEEKHQEEEVKEISVNSEIKKVVSFVLWLAVGFILIDELLSNNKK